MLKGGIYSIFRAFLACELSPKRSLFNQIISSRTPAKTTANY